MRMRKKRGKLIPMCKVCESKTAHEEAINLTDKYITMQLYREGFKKADITEEMIEMKRAMVRLRRLIRNKAYGRGANFKTAPRQKECYYEKATG